MECAKCGEPPETHGKCCCHTLGLCASWVHSKHTHLVLTCQHEKAGRMRVLDKGGWIPVLAMMQRMGVEDTAPDPEHDCMQHATPYDSAGPLGHGWECGVCGSVLQVG